MITKEKVLALVSILIALFVLYDLQRLVPGGEAIAAAPPEEEARVYRSTTAAPVLAPEEIFNASRDPFQIQDVWGQAPPALLALPPRQTWGRSLPGGLRSLPQTPADRLIVETLPGRGGDR